MHACMSHISNLHCTNEERKEGASDIQSIDVEIEQVMSSQNDSSILAEYMDR
jgi:hypothetical protein